MKRILTSCLLLLTVLAATGRTGRIAVSGGGNVYYEEQGQGEPVILLHGHSLDLRMWDSQWRALSRRYRAMRMDFRGYGRSSAQSETLQFTHADDVLTLMDSLGIRQAHVVGLSMGAFVAGDLLAMHPERLLSCTMASGGIRSTPGPSQPMGAEERAVRDREIAALKLKGVEQMKREWLEQLVSSGGSQRERLRRPLRRMIADWTAWQPLHKEVRLFYASEAWQRLRLCRSSVPVLMVRGATEVKDAQGEPAELRYVARGRYVVLPDCGHMLNMEQPEAFNRTLLDFLSTVEPTSAEAFDAVVAQDGSGQFTSLQAAIDAAPTNSKTWYHIHVKAGTYREHVCIPADKPRLRITGEGMDRTFVSDDRVSGGPRAVSVDLGATVVVLADDITFEDLSFVNAHGHEHLDGPQALALYTKADRAALYRCGLYSYQDTYRTSNLPNGRQYLRDCVIEGAVDFIYGNGNAFFDRCTLLINRPEGGWIVAPKHSAYTCWGYVFDQCTITTADGHPADTWIWLGRPWHYNPRTVWLNTRAEVTLPPEGWYETMGGLPAVFAEYNTTDGQGRPLDLSRRISRYYAVHEGDTVWCTAKALLTPEEAAEYTVARVLRGDDHWTPEQP